MKERRDIWRWILDNLLSIISVIPIVFGVIATAWNWLKKGQFTMYDYILLLVVISLSLFMIIKQIIKKHNCRAVFFPGRFLYSSYSYIILEKVITYKRTVDDKLKYKRKWTIKAVNNQLSDIKDKYIWTGSNTDFSIQSENGIRRIETENRIGIWNCFRIYLNNSIKKGEIAEFAYSWPLISNIRDSYPFISVSTEEPTKNIVLKLQLGEQYKYQMILCEEYHSSDSDYSISSKKERLDENGEYIWTINNARRFRVYQIRWSWDEGKEPEECYSREG